MWTIYKYPLQEQETTLLLPVSARPLTVQTQAGRPMLWVLLDPAEPEVVQRKFIIFGTGKLIDVDPEELAYIATFQLDGGALIFHVFELCSMNLPSHIGSRK